MAELTKSQKQLMITLYEDLIEFAKERIAEITAELEEK